MGSGADEAAQDAVDGRPRKAGTEGKQSRSRARGLGAKATSSADGAHPATGDATWS